MKKWIVMLCVLILSGCAIPSTPAVDTLSSAVSVKEPDLTQIQSDLIQLTQRPRPIGSEGEADAVHYLHARFEAMGFSVTLQECTSEGGAAGSNVIAIRKAEGTRDILVISAHHDSTPASFGANDDASGVAALLLAAEKLASTDTDTELRFISFTDEENGKNGSRHYIKTLPEAERKRIVGCIQLDMLGGLGSEGTMVCTVDGSANWLSDLLMAQDGALTLGAETTSDHVSFQLAGIPAAVVTQAGRGYLYHTAGDTADQLDLGSIYRAGSAVADVAAFLASGETPSYHAMVREQAGSYLYHHSRQSRILYSMSRQENEACLGLSGQLVRQWEETGNGWTDTYEAYAYFMGWFGSGRGMPTHYIYRNGYLEDVKIYPVQAGYTTEAVKLLIQNTHGVPIQEDETHWNWADELYGNYISLEEEKGEAVVRISPYSLGISNLLASYEVTAGEAVIENIQHAEIWELLCTAIPLKHRQRIGQFQLFTDGFSNMLAYASTMGDPERPDNTHFSITIDYYDVYDEHGDPRDQSKLWYTLIHEYGHVLLENEMQIDVTTEPDIHNPGGFLPGSFRQRYYEKFWQDPYTSYLGTYWDEPENYVSEYAGNMFHEDIADTFAVFVFGSKPEGESIAEQKIRFFWEDREMVSLRGDIRAGLGLA